VRNGRARLPAGRGFGRPVAVDDEGKGGPWTAPANVVGMDHDPSALLRRPDVPRDLGPNQLGDRPDRGALERENALVGREGENGAAACA
jgi:hypothetical protein